MIKEFKMGDKIKIEESTMIIATVHENRETLYNLIDINTGERWFVFALNYYKMLNALNHLSDGFEIEFVKEGK